MVRHAGGIVEFLVSSNHNRFLTGSNVSSRHKCIPNENVKVTQSLVQAAHRAFPGLGSLFASVKPSVRHAPGRNSPSLVSLSSYIFPFALIVLICPIPSILTSQFNRNQSPDANSTAKSTTRNHSLLHASSSGLSHHLILLVLIF